MKFIDKLFGRKNDELTQEQNEKTEMPILYKNEMNGSFGYIKDFSKELSTIGITENGRPVYQYYNPNNEINYGEHYDTIRVIVEKARIIENKKVYELAVKYFNASDVHVIGAPDEYQKVLSELDLDEMYYDPEYFKYTLTKLLNKSRVDRYMSYGLMEEDEIAREQRGDPKVVACGRYVGGVVKRGNNNFKRVFDMDIGAVAHRLPEMQQERFQNRMMVNEDVQKKIAHKVAEQARLQSEINALNEQRRNMGR